ncbi:aflatoxin B1-aldehyde reductase, partial [Amylostereum chailletii]
GAAVLGSAGFFATISNIDEAQSFVDVLVRCRHRTLDTARGYGGGTSEEIISQLDLKDCKVDTKIYPSQPKAFADPGIKELVAQSLKALAGTKIQTLYLQAPDRSTPFEETLSAINELHEAGHFELFGLSNFYSWEVAEVVTLCRFNGYVQPTVYQGIYNMLDRVVEDERVLFPCLRKYGLHFAAYSPLGGGFLTGAYLEAGTSEAMEKNRRGERYVQRYSQTTPLLKKLKTIGDVHGMCLSEIAVRWLVHHSQMLSDDHGIVYGGRTVTQLEAVLGYHARGPLPEEIIQIVEGGWEEIKGRTPSYIF